MEKKEGKDVERALKPMQNLASGHAVVLLHGFGGSVHSWRRAWPGLCESSSVVVAFDRPGFGLTSRPIPVNGHYGFFTKLNAQGKEESYPQQNPYTLDYAVRLTLKLLDHLRIERAVLVGHSTGGAVALACAAIAPHRVSALVLLAPHVYSEAFPELSRSMLRSKLGKSVVEQLVRTDFGEMVLRRAWRHPKLIPADIITLHKRVMRLPNWHEAMLEIAQAPAEHAERYLSGVKVPTLILQGRHDKFVMTNETGRVLEALNNNGDYARLEIIEEGGHVIHEELPEVFIHHIQAFLSALVVQHKILPKY